MSMVAVVSKGRRFRIVDIIAVTMRIARKTVRASIQSRTDWGNSTSHTRMRNVRMAMPATAASSKLREYRGTFLHNGSRTDPHKCVTKVEFLYGMHPGWI